MGGNTFSWQIRNVNSADVRNRRLRQAKRASSGVSYSWDYYEHSVEVEL